MDGFSIDEKRALQIAEDMKAISIQYKRINLVVNSSLSKVLDSGVLTGSHRSYARNANEETENLAERIETLSETLTDIAKKYRHDEMSLTMFSMAKSVDDKIEAINMQAGTFLENSFLGMVNIVGCAGKAGKAIKTIVMSTYNTIKGEYDDMDLREGLGLVKGGFSAAVGLVEGASRKMSISQLFGFNVSDKLSTAPKWADRFRENVNNADSITEDFKKGGLKTGAKVLEVGMTLGMNYLDNREEMETEGISHGRAITETVVETVVDIAKSYAVKTIVVAAVGATAGAPVIVGAIAAHAVTEMADYVSNKVFGKDLTEVVSDGIIDTAQEIGKRCKAVCEKADEIASGVRDFIGSGISNIGNGFKSLFA